MNNQEKSEAIIALGDDLFNLLYTLENFTCNTTDRYFNRGAFGKFITETYLRFGSFISFGCKKSLRNIDFLNNNLRLSTYDIIGKFNRLLDVCSDDIEKDIGVFVWDIYHTFNFQYIRISDTEFKRLEIIRTFIKNTIFPLLKDKNGRNKIINCLSVFQKALESECIDINSLYKVWTSIYLYKRDISLDFLSCLLNMNYPVNNSIYRRFHI